VITELNVLLEFLHSAFELSGNPKLKEDYQSLLRRIRWAFGSEEYISNDPSHVAFHKPDAILSLAVALKSLFESIKDGINKEQFTLEQPCDHYWSLLPRSPLPRFLSTVTTRIFSEEDGKLLPNPDLDAIEFTISALMLTKRISLETPTLTVPAHNKAVKQFVQEQRVKVPVCKTTWEALKGLLEIFWREGRPIPSYAPNGPGSVLGVNANTYIPQFAVCYSTRKTKKFKDCSISTYSLFQFLWVRVSLHLRSLAPSSVRM